MSYRRSSYGGIRSRRPVYSGYARARRMPVSRSGYRRAVVPRARVLARYPAGLFGGRGATELKSVDATGTAAVDIGQAGGIGMVFKPPVNGAAFYNRIGTRTRAKSLEIRGMIKPTYTNVGAITQQYARIIVLYDRQPNGSLPSVADVLTDYPSGGVAETGSCFMGLNMNNRDRFLVLRDRKFILPGLGANGANPATGAVFPDPNTSTTFTYTEFIKLKGLESHYKANDGLIGDIATGSFLILVQGFDDAAAIKAWQLVYRARFKFFD